MYEELKSTKNRVVGLKQSLKELNTGSVAQIYIADDADIHIKGKVRKAAGDSDTPIVSVESMDMLGEICGINVRAACAAILKITTLGCEADE